MRRTVFVVDGDPISRELCREWLGWDDVEVRVFERFEPALAALAQDPPATFCLDLDVPGTPGLEALARLRREHPGIPVVALGDREDAAATARAIALGAAGHVPKPASPETFREAVRAALHRYDLDFELRSLRVEADAGRAGRELVGRSRAVERIAAQVAMAADSDVPVLIEGETGTGKEMIARLIHDAGPRRTGPFVAVNCGAIPRDLQESQFFGHERGAFVGAGRTHAGWFEQAGGGTIYLDEVSELQPAAQISLLRVLQESRVWRLGSAVEIPIDVRVISASNRDLREWTARGAFREDLYYRLVVFPIVVPPLRERREDIPLLFGHFARRLAEEMERPVPEVTADALAALVAHDWPGNLRELQNAVRFALLASRGRRIEKRHLPAEARAAGGRAPAPTAESSVSLVDPVTGRFKTRERIEREVFARAVEAAGGNMRRAASWLGVSRSTLYRRLREPADEGQSDS